MMHCPLPLLLHKHLPQGGVSTHSMVLDCGETPKQLSHLQQGKSLMAGGSVSHIRALISPLKV